MRIHFIAGQDKADSAGFIADELRKRGEKIFVTIVHFEAGSGLLRVKAEESHGEVVVRISGSLNRWIQQHYKWLGRLLKSAWRTEVDVVHVFGLHPLGATFSALGKKNGIPVVLSPDVMELLNGLTHLNRPDWHESALREASTVILEADVLRGHLPGSQQVEVVQPFLTEGAFSFRPRPVGSSLYFLMAGEWNDEQPVVARPKLAMKALAEIESELGKPVILGVIGGGNRMPELKKYANGLGLHCQFFGKLTEMEQAREFQKADFFLHPVDFALFPQFVFRAFQCGVPVLASDVEGMAAFVGDESGLLVKNKLSLWKSALLDISKTSFDRHAIAEMGRSKCNASTGFEKLQLTYSSIA